MEFAILLPILTLLLFGVIEFGIVLSDSISLRQGVREGARQASVSRVDSCGSVSCTTDARIDITGAQIKVVLPAGYVKGEPVLVCAQKEIKSITGMFAPILDGTFIRSKVEMRIEKVDTPTVISESSSGSGDWSWCS